LRPLCEQDAALASLKSLNKNDVVEVRAMQRPPDGVRLVVEAVCIIKGVKPKRVPGEKVRVVVVVVVVCYVMLWDELVLGAVMSQSNCKDT